MKNRPILRKFGTLHYILNPMTVTWRKIEFFKIQDGGGRHLENSFLAITHKPIVRFQRNFVRGSRMACRQGLHDKNCKFLKSKMADGPHFDNRKIAISQWKIVRFWWNLVYYIRYWTRWQSRDQTLKFLKFKMAVTAILKIDIENRFFGHNSSTICPISAKFCMRKQNGMSTRATWQTLQIFVNQDGGRPPFWKSLNRHISMKNRPILMKFGTLLQTVNQTAVSWRNIFLNLGWQ